MSLFGSRSAAFWLRVMRRELSAWFRAEKSRWLYVFKCVLGMLLAMGLAMLFSLDQPRMALVGVFIVMRPQTGLILRKSLYRIGGSAAGLVASLLLVSLFAQERVLFLLALSLWIGICTAGAAFYRDFKSYACILAGYSTTFVGLVAVPHPYDFFQLTVTRLSEVTLGILCAGVVNDLIFPQRLYDQIIGNVQSRYTEFMVLVRASLSGAAGKMELAAMQFRLVRAVIGLEAIRSAAILEDHEARSRNRRLRRLNGEFMAVTTTFHSFHRLMGRLTGNVTPAGRALNGIYASLGPVLATTGASPRSAGEAETAARRIAAFRTILSKEAAAATRNTPYLNQPENLMDFETAIGLLRRFIRELHAFTRTYATLSERGEEPEPPDDICFSTHTDPLVALLIGTRALVSLLLIGLFWIASAWPYGASALTFVAITSAFFGSVPNQKREVRQMIIGHLVSYIIVILYTCFVIPSLDGFALLCAALAPILILGIYISTYPQWAGLGTGLTLFFCMVLAPTNPMVFNPVGVINDGGAAILGTVVVGLVFMTLAPATGEWHKRRMADRIRRQVVRACSDPLSGLISRFESANCDLLHRLDVTSHLERDGNARFVEWMFSVREIGRAIIHLRGDAAMIQAPGPVSDRVRESVRSTARLFERLSAQRRQEAIESVTMAIDAIHDEAASESAGHRKREILRRLLGSLHLIRTALLDDETALAAAIGSAPDHAAMEGIACAT